MRPPYPLTLGLALGLAWLAAGLACSATDEPRLRVEAGPRPLKIQLDERSVLVGDVVERLEAEDYVYLRLAIVGEGAATGRDPEPRSRWVALEGRAPSLGERVRVRSLARRTRVWAPQLERDFETLEYVALLPDAS